MSGAPAAAAAAAAPFGLGANGGPAINGPDRRRHRNKRIIYANPEAALVPRPDAIWNGQYAPGQPGRGRGSSRRRGAGRGDGQQQQQQQHQPQQQRQQQPRQQQQQRQGQQDMDVDEPPAPPSRQQQQHARMPLPGAAAAAAAAAAPRKQHADSRTSSTTMSQITSEKFDALDIHPQLKKGIKEAMGYEMMTKVQAAAIPGTLCDLTL
jgi:hypothetical protein